MGEEQHAAGVWQRESWNKGLELGCGRPGMPDCVRGTRAAMADFLAEMIRDVNKCTSHI